MTPPAADRDLVARLGLLFLDGPDGVGNPAQPGKPPRPNRAVRDGLTVRAWPVADDRRAVTAVTNAAGVAVFHRLPPIQARLGYLTEVRDGWGRFLTGRVWVAADRRGVVPVVLWSAAGRTVPPGRLAVRADLWDATADRAAAFAVLTVRLAGNGEAVVAEGLSDADGRVLALGDWPRPPAAGPTDRWDAPRAVSVQVRYLSGARPTAPRLDELDKLPAVRVLAAEGKDDPFVPPRLSPAAATVLRSAGPAGRLLVKPA